MVYSLEYATMGWLGFSAWRLAGKGTVSERSAWSKETPYSNSLTMASIQEGKRMPRGREDAAEGK